MSHAGLPLFAQNGLASPESLFTVPAAGYGLGIAAGMAAVAAAGWAVRSPRSTVFGPSVYRSPAGRKSIALTFDDGPSESTPRVLDLLAEFQVPATFFQCGVNVKRLPGVARQVADAGHEIGNHTYSHAMLKMRSAGFIYGELESAQQVIQDTTGATPSLFRAPFGVRWFGLRSAQEKLGLLGVMWTVIGRDWILPGERIADRLLEHAREGAIICLHDGRETAASPDISATLEAVRRVVPRWIERGFQFETVSQTLCKTN